MPAVLTPFPARVACRDCASQQAPQPAPRPGWARLLASALALLLVLLPTGCGPERKHDAAPLAASAPAAPLQEVAPPPGVQQLTAALADHSPQLKILAPADGATLPDGPWTLRLQLRDWPLADAGELGLGAHVVVQLDDEPPQRLTEPSRPANGELSLAMDPLRPGSHRLTAYAARPWGEAVKSPGAYSQIQLQRVAATPLRVPAAGSPQLIAVSPGPEPRPEPVLVDWLLLDAPLQGLREGDASWRLRVSVNGDSFLVDQNTPLWLKGWRSGSNSLQLDLVDGRGEPLNPPFNSLVSEVVVQAGGPRPSWLGRLEPAALVRLLGQEPLVEPEAVVGPEPAVEPAATTQPPAPAAAQPEAPSTPHQSDTGELEELDGPDAESLKSSALNSSSLNETARQDSSVPAGPTTSSAVVVEADAPLEAGEPPAPAPAPPSPAPPAPAVPAAPQPPAARPNPANPERIAPSTSLSGSAREQVREDGSLIKEKGNGPLAGLRQRLGS